jgi:hypothetical protein
MTTEIAVINRLGIALAADSAVTISGFGVEKVFDTGDKLFELSVDHPLAIMVNGNLDFMGVPWEIIIKDFRKEKFDPVPAKIEDWATEFLKFVKGHRAVNAKQTQAWLRAAISTEIDEISKCIAEAIQKALRASPAPTVNSAAVKGYIRFELRRRADLYQERAAIHSLADLPLEQIMGSIGPTVTEMQKRIFGDIDPDSDDVDTLHRAIAGRLRTSLRRDLSTGLVVCGFGRDDLFPFLFSVSLDGVVADRLRYSVTHRVEITRDTEVDNGNTKELGTALSFAQTDVINRLLRGADQRFIVQSRQFIESTIAESMPTLFAELGYSVASEDGAAVDLPAVARIISQTLASEYGTFAKGVSDEIEGEFKRTIALMPKQELIELAEALVGITAVERKASYDAGTVGGPIDVALITRAEGFIWVKRKHHFKADMNLRYLSRVFGWAEYGGEGK